MDRFAARNWGRGGEELLPACINSNGVMIGGGRSPAWDLPTSPPSDHLPPAASEDGAWEGYSVKLETKVREDFTITEKAPNWCFVESSQLPPSINTLC